MTKPVFVTVEREVRAEPGVVFDAWLDPDRAKYFLFTIPEGGIVRCDIDARVGGRFLITDRRPDGDADHHGEFLEIKRSRRISFLFRGPATEEGDWSTVTIDFAPTPSACRLVLTHEIPPAWASFADPVRSGWTMILERFADQMERRDG